MNSRTLLAAEPATNTLASGPVIKTKALTKRYGDFTAVDHLDLEIRSGEVFGLLGPNGAGKTTTILMLLGLTEPTSGSVRVLGTDPTRDPLVVKAKVGYLPDEVGFYDDLTARENLRYTAALNRIPRREVDERIDGVLHAVGLLDEASLRVRAFSRGMRQRLGVADALVKQPRVLILDEPTVNIDPEGVRELLLLVERLRSDHGVTIVLSSHLLHQVQQVCDRIGIFVRGRLRACGSIDELASDLDERWVFTIGLTGITEPISVLRSMPPVRSVERGEGGWLVHSDADIRPMLHHVVTDAGGQIVHLARQSADLDAIYHRYFGEPGHDPFGDTDHG